VPPRFRRISSRILALYLSRFFARHRALQDAPVDFTPLPEVGLVGLAAEVGRRMLVR
jgi:hypothetical protein